MALQIATSAQVYDSARVCGSARVYDSAQVYDSARVYGSAQVCGSAWVYGSARVCGSAQVCGSAWVYGSARVYGSAWVYGSARVYGSALVSDHMVIDRPDGYVCHGPIGSEHRYATAAWDYKRREICVRAGCWYGSLTELEARIAHKDTWPGATAVERRKWRTQYKCLIAAASWIDPPSVWPEVVD